MRASGGDRLRGLFWPKARRGWHLCGRGSLRTADNSHVGDKTIADLGKGLDETRIARIVVELPADLGDALHQGVVGYGGLAPDGRGQFILGDEGLGKLDKVEQQLKALITQREFPAFMH